MSARNKNEDPSGRELEAYLEAARADLGEPPSDARLLALHRGELDPEEADRIREHIALDPDVATRFDELASYPSQAKPGDADYLSDSELEEHWQRFRAELGSREAESPPTREGVGEGLVVSMRERPGGPPLTNRLRIAYGAAGLAVLLAVVLGLGYLYRGQELDRLRSELADLGSAGPTTDLYSGILTGFEPFRSKATAVPTRLPPGRQAYYLVLTQPEPPPGSDVPYDAEYRLEIWPTPSDRDNRDRKDGNRGAGAAPLWQQDGLRFSARGELPVLIPGHFLEAGEYDLDLFRLEDGEEVLGTRYLLSI